VAWHANSSWRVLTPMGKARIHPRVPRAESWAVVVDVCFAGWHVCQFLFNHLGGISYRSVVSPFFSRYDLAPLISNFQVNYTLEFFLAPSKGSL
jgi:hypothetical protein